MSTANERRIRQPDQRIREILDKLDRSMPAPAARSKRAAERFSYRVSEVTVDVQALSGPMRMICPTRNLSRLGVSFLANSFVYTGSPCIVYLVDRENQVIATRGVVVRCSYIEGTGSVHECGVKFDEPINPADFDRSVRQLRVLTADDDTAIQAAVKRIFTTLNYRVLTVDNGRLAVDATRSESFCVALLDVEMPELDGISAVKQMRSHGYLRPVVAMVERDDDQARQLCDAAGFDGLIPKPLELGKLVTILKQLVQR